MRARFALIVSIAACGSGASRPAAPAHVCKADASLLFVAAIPPAPDEQLDYRTDTTFRFRGPDGERISESHFATHERVTSVDNDEIEELEVKFVDGKYHPAREEHRDLSGRTFRFRFQNGEPAYWEGDAPALPEDHAALRAYERNDVGQPYWLLRMLTDRTFQVGVETHIPPESAPASSKGTATDARLTLKKVEGTLATFSADVTITTDQMPLRARGDVVLDIGRARLVSSRFAFDLEMSSEAKEKGFGLHGEWTDSYRYAQPASTAPKTRCDDAAPVVLTIPYRPPVPGEQFSFEQQANIDLTLTGPGGTHRVRGGWHTETDERVLTVGEGVMTSLEAHIRKSDVRPITLDAEPPTLSHAGKKLVIAWKSPNIVFELDGAPVEPTKDFAAQVLYRADVPLRHWITRLVTERTFELGVETRSTHELVYSVAPGPADVRIMLESVDAEVAHFKVDMRVAVDTEAGRIPMYLQGTIDFDTARSRPLHLALSGTYDMKDRVAMEGPFELAQTFRYR